jgi:hypothetical protein
VIAAVTGVSDGLPCPARAPAVAVCGYPDLGIHDRRHLFFLEPDHLREQLDFPTHLPVPLSSYGNVVYSIHAYTHKFTLDAILGQAPDRAGYPPGGFELSYATAEQEARAMGTALFVSEFGNEPEQDGLLLVNQLREQDRHLVGATVWPWKENCTLTTSWGVYAGVYEGAGDQRCAYDGHPDTAPKPQSGCLRQGRERLLAQAWPRAIAASEVSFHYDPASGAFDLLATATATAPPALVYLPPEVRGQPLVSGSAGLEQVNVGADASRLLVVKPRGGQFRVSVAPAPLRLVGCL